MAISPEMMTVVSHPLFWVVGVLFAGTALWVYSLRKRCGKLQVDLTTNIDLKDSAVDSKKELVEEKKDLQKNLDNVKYAIRAAEPAETVVKVLEQLLSTKVDEVEDIFNQVKEDPASKPQQKAEAPAEEAPATEDGGEAKD